MIVDLPNTTTGALSARLVRLRADQGAMALSRVLTLVVVVEDEALEDAIEVANAASRHNPCRIIVVGQGERRGRARIDGQIRVGGDAGASEVVVMRLFGEVSRFADSVVTPLLLADSPIVAWWPREFPRDPADDPIGAMAQRRVTDSAKCSGNPRSTLTKLAENYRDGDTDLAWSRITLWRALLAASLDQAPFEAIDSAEVVGAKNSPSADLLGGWLAARLRCPVRLSRTTEGSGLVSVTLTRASGTIHLFRPTDGNVGTLQVTGRIERRIALPHRSDAECLADELRRLDPDQVYEEALRHGVPEVTVSRRVARADGNS